MKKAGLSKIFLCGLLCCLTLPACVSADLDPCPMGELGEIDGKRHLALIVGVGKYKSDRIRPLSGAPNDARSVYDLLTGAKGQGYGFPAQNVCLLLNEAATTQNVKKAFEQLLVQGVRKGKNDLAVFYYAGHGSQLKDLNGDEDDRCDETFLLHDARTGSGEQRVGDLIDDEFNGMLSRLQEKTDNVVVILDSCNSGTATRGPSGLVARWQDPEDPAMACPKLSEKTAKAESSWRPEAMPGLMALTAASDGTPALEIDGHGIFTRALVEVLTQGTDQPLTYAQVSRQVPPLMKVDSYQIPYFQGDLNRSVFDTTGKRRPLGWDVTGVGETIELSGAPINGMGVGAELRIYDGAALGSMVRDPTKAKATVAVIESSRINAKAKVSAVEKNASAIVQGDLAVLIRPSDETLKIKVRLRPESETGGIPTSRASRLRQLISNNEEASMFIELVPSGDSFELSMEHDRIVLRGPENNIRNRYTSDSAVPESLWQHARQKALLNLRGEGGADFTDHQTLQVQLVPAKKQADDVQGEWKQAPPNIEQIIPLGYRWHVQVSLSKDAPMPLLVGALILSSDGSSYGLPCDGRAVRLRAGETATFNAGPNRQGCPLGETFGAAPPLDTQDYVLAFGTQETNPVPWHVMTETAKTRSARGRGGPLYRALDRYMRPGTRGVDRPMVEDEPVTTTWTMSSLTLRVVEP